MKRSEVELLLKLLPRYYAHVERYPHTLLIKFFGLHRVKPATGGKVRLSRHPCRSLVGCYRTLCSNTGLSPLQAEAQRCRRRCKHWFKRRSG